MKVRIKENIYNSRLLSRRKTCIAKKGRTGEIDSDDARHVGTATHISVILHGNKIWRSLPAWKLEIIEDEN